MSEVYSFSLDELKSYEDYVDFEWLSRNRNIKWSVEIITEFYSKWNWEALEENRYVFNSLTLGLFFPDKVDLPVCNCSKRKEFCENPVCSVISNKFRFAKTLNTIYPDAFINLMIMCDSGLIDQKAVKKFYKTQETKDLLSFDISL